MRSIQLQCILFILSVMFATNQAHLSPLSSLMGNTENSHWIAVELAFSRPWFLVSLKEFEADSGSDPEEDFSVTRTIFVDSIGSVEQLIESDTNGLVKYESVQICTPDHMNGTSGWKLEPLDSVQTAHHHEFQGHTLDVFVTLDGHKYAHSMLGTPIEDLILGDVWFKAPCA